jgi:long-chain fatty acid transport protein
MLLQISGAWAYQLTDKLSVGVSPNINWASLELMPNPTANPSPTAGYPSTDTATAIGFGAQFGVFYDTQTGFKFGLSYKTTQAFGDFEFDNTYLDGTTAENKFNMDYPSIASLGIGYSKGLFDLALDYRFVDYEDTDGFSETGWTPTASVAGFGWENISIVSAGLQFKGVDKLPLRVGYTYSGNPIPEEVTFFNIPATAIIKHAFQVGFSYQPNDTLSLDAVFHYGTSDGATEGPLLNPALQPMYPPYGAFPGSSVSYDMTTSMIQFGVSYTFKRNTNTP